MRVLDEAVFAALNGVKALTGKVFYGSPLRDTAPGFVSYYPVNSKLTTLTGGFLSEGRLFNYELIAADRSGVTAETLVEAAEAALLNQRLPVAGWGMTQVITWAGDIHDLGDLVVDGTVIHFAGRLMTIIIQQPRTT